MQTRRHFLETGLSLAAAAAFVPSAKAAKAAGYTAVVFDAFVIFDPRPVTNLAETLFPQRGAALVTAWRTRQFEYTWLRSISKRYADFLEITQDALVFAAKTTKVELTRDKQRQLVNAHTSLRAWPDARATLKMLKERGLTLALLSNFTQAMLLGCINAADLAGMFDHVLSTDAVKTYKPDPRAYQLGVDELQRERNDILYAAFAGWDAAGAKAFGYSTFWVNRAGATLEELGLNPDATGANLADLLAFL